MKKLIIAVAVTMLAGCVNMPRNQLTVDYDCGSAGPARIYAGDFVPGLYYRNINFTTYEDASTGKGLFVSKAGAYHAYVTTAPDKKSAQISLINPESRMIINTDTCKVLRRVDNSGKVVYEATK